MSKKVLLVDDEDNIRELLRVALEDEDLDLYEAADGIEALAKAREIKPDLIVLDVMMPGMVGYKVCEQLKSDPETKDVYVLFLTARGSPLAEMTGKLKGGDAYMTKPFDPMELTDHVLKALGLE